MLHLHPKTSTPPSREALASLAILTATPPGSRLEILVDSDGFPRQFWTAPADQESLLSTTEWVKANHVSRTLHD